MRARFDARSIQRVYADGFYMDNTDVTRARFAEFVKATGRLTIPERIPRPKDFPGAPPENLVAGGIVSCPFDLAFPRNDHLQRWSYVKGHLAGAPAVRRATFAGKRTIRLLRSPMKTRQRERRPNRGVDRTAILWEASPFSQLPRYLLRDRDALFGNEFRQQVRGMGICEVLSAPRSPWQRAYAEWFGSIRRECFDHVIVCHESSLRTTRQREEG